MKHVVLNKEHDVALDLEGIRDHLSRICSSLQVSVGEAVLVLSGEEVSTPASHRGLDLAIREEIRDASFAVLATNKPYDNNFFWEDDEGVVILSFYEWEYLTQLPRNNGLVFLLASMISQEFIDDRHHDAVTGCIYDFWWDKKCAVFFCRCFLWRHKWDRSRRRWSAAKWWTVSHRPRCLVHASYCWTLTRPKSGVP